MKLTDISIEGYQGIHHVHLSQLSPGLNVLYHGNIPIQTAIRNFVMTVLYGHHDYDHHDYLGPGMTPNSSAWPMGNLKIQSGGHHYRLTRSYTADYGGLIISDLSGNNLGHRTPDLLAKLDLSAYRNFFNIDLGAIHWCSESFVSELESRFDLGSAATPFNGDVHAFEQWKIAADQRQSTLETLRRELDRNHGQRTALVAELGTLQVAHQDRVAEIERELDCLQSDLRSLTQRLEPENRRLSEMESQISDLMLAIEQGQSSVQHVPLTRSHPNQLAMLYQRLDEIDGQIRRWRSVQKEIQGQRVRIRDEMATCSELSIESNDHPYHTARQLLNALESKVGRTENLAKSWNPHQDLLEESRQLLGLCVEMRDDLYALCQELGHQYKHVRHKAAIAELKQLRRCYHEMDENVKRLILRRDTVIEEVRQLDPAGADAVVRADLQFCQCAEHEGYLEARKQYVDRQFPAEVEYRTIYTDSTVEREQLTQLRNQRAELKESAASNQDRIRHMTRRQEELRDERNALLSRRDSELNRQIRDCDSRIEDLEGQIQSLQLQVDNDRQFYGWRPNYLLNDATRYLKTLSHGNWQQIWIDAGRSIKIKSRSGQTCDFHSLDRSARLSARLCLTLAALDQFALRGIRLPVVIQYDDPATTIADGLLPAVEAFGRNGHQVILITGNQLVAQSARKINAAVFELADTHITIPSWYPDSPTVDRPTFPQSTTDRTTFALNKYAMARNEFNKLSTATGIGETRPLSRLADSLEPPIIRVSPSVPLQDVDIVESIYLNSLERNGIRTVGHLLDLDIDHLEPGLIQCGFTADQLDRWQAQALLMVCLPELTSGDARVLVGSGISDPEFIMRASESELLERIHRYFESSSGRRSNLSPDRFDSVRLRRLADWLRQHSAWREWTGNRRPRAGYSYSSNGSPGKSKTQVTAGPRYPLRSDDRLSDAAEKKTLPRKTILTAVSATNMDNPSARSDKYRFFLELTDNIEAAPSIGTRTAERFEAIGVHTIEDFLTSSAEQLAKRLDNRRMSAKVIRTWQKQTRLMCCVPNLRNHDAQLLVACGVSQADDLAQMDPDKLLGIVEPFSKTKEGTRILRTGKKPDLAEVTLWVDSANHRRQLQAS